MIRRFPAHFNSRAGMRPNARPASVDFEIRKTKGILAFAIKLYPA
jgi:hypothetical protein